MWQVNNPSAAGEPRYEYSSEKVLSGQEEALAVRFGKV
jgi:hypothetical protein